MRDNLIDEFRFCCCWCCCCCHNALVSIAVSLLLRCNFLLYSLISFVSFCAASFRQRQLQNINCQLCVSAALQWLSVARGRGWRGGGVCVAFAFAFVASFVWHEKLRMPHEMTAVKLPATGTCRLWLQRKKREGKEEREGKVKVKRRGRQVRAG